MNKSAQLLTREAAGPRRCAVRRLCRRRGDGMHGAAEAMPRRANVRKGKRESVLVARLERATY
jgi:hypothetical protein